MEKMPVLKIFGEILNLFEAFIYKFAVDTGKLKFCFGLEPLNDELFCVFCFGGVGL